MQVKRLVKQSDKDYVTIDWDDGNPLKAWWRARNPLRIFWNFSVIKMTSYAPEVIKNYCLRKLLGVSIGEESAIAPGTELDYFYPELISVGDHVIIGEEATLLTHEFQQHKLRFGSVVVVKDNATVGAFSIIRSGATIEENTRVGFGAVIHKDVGPDETIVGSPMERLEND